MKITEIGRIKGGQDGAIYKSKLFRFDHHGTCYVYELSDLKNDRCEELSPIAQIAPYRDDLLPHNNAVCFGSEFFEQGDEYPLLYTNIYNNYADAEDKMLGTCCVYRIQNLDGRFKSTLVQIIQIGFCEDAELWKATENEHGERPYGNFLVDNSTASYYAFVMRDEEKGTRYFRFDLPSVRAGELDPKYNVPRVILTKEDIKESFDTGYYRFIQGAALHDGKIYSTEGFSNDQTNRPALRVMDLATKKEKYIDIMDLGFSNEPEFIDFYNGDCLYSDADGVLYRIDF